MTTTVKITLLAVIATALASVSSAQLTPGFPAGVNTFASPGSPNTAQFATDLGDLYFDSEANVPSVIQTWNPGPVNFTAALGGNPFKPEGGTVETIFIGKTAGWLNDFAYSNSAAPTTYTPLVTRIDDDPITGNVHSGWETSVNYAAGTSLEFWLNSGGDLSQGGLFSAFGSSNLFAGTDTTSHVRWTTRNVTTTYFNGVSTVTTEVPTLLIGFEDTRTGVSFYDGDFNDLVVGFQFLPTQSVPVPEPSTYGLIGAAALLGLVGYRRFKRKAA
jgi:hypothetical protein